MIWPTNYSKLANQVAFTLFFAGKDFAPNAIIDDKNIDDYLQDLLLNAMLYFYKRIAKETTLFNNSVFAVESLNEPNAGLIAIPDITAIPETQKLRKGGTPTAFQSMLLGSGQSCEVDVYEFSTLGPKKTGTEIIDPEGLSAWIQDDSYDKKYGFKRDPGWELGRCIWAQNGVWDDQTNEPLIVDYFGFCPDDGQPLDESVFVNKYWIRYWNKFYFAMRELDKDLFLLAQPPTLSIPPDLRDSAFMDSRVIYAPHYYDGLTLVQKHWSNIWNVDVLGVLRGRYASPAFAIKLGRTAIRNCIRDQLKAIKQEGVDHMGQVPCIMTETGMPFDLDDKNAYKSGNYGSQEDALDALGFALEGSQLHHTLWTYCSSNSHRFGDCWNGEDFSFYCKSSDGNSLLDSLERNISTSSLDTLASSSENSEYTLMYRNRELSQWSTRQGSRAEVAIARPYPVAVAGNILEFGYDMRAAKFSMTIDGDDCVNESIGTDIVIPEYSFPGVDFSVTASTGKWKFDYDTRTLTWFHAEGEQTIDITSQSQPVLSQSTETQTWFGYICACCGIF